MPQIEKPAISNERSLFDDKVQQVVSFLMEHYDIRIPIQDPAKIQISCKDKHRYTFPPTFNDISLHLMSESIIVGDNMLRKIIRSPNQIAPVNPVINYFNRIRGQWKGVSHIDILSSHIIPRVFDGNSDTYYRERTDRLIRKWLVACVACWTKGISNDVALGFVDVRGGSGKTYFTQFILPDELSEFYVQASKDEHKFDIEDAYTRYMIVNFEELNGLSKGSINTFKMAQTCTHITTKMRHEEFPSKKNRLACSMFNTNFNEENGGFIQSWYGPDTRRFGCIEIADIQQEYSTIVDVDQMWSEALTLCESSSFNYHFDKADYEEFNAYNARYKFETDAMRYIQSYTEIPENDNEGEKLNPTQILQRLIKDRRIKSEDMNKITPQKIGLALNALGYQAVTYRSKTDNNEPRKGYHLKFI